METLEKECRACKLLIVYSEVSPEACPHCHETFWNKPGDERRLFQLQKSFIEGGRTNAKKELDEIYEIICRYTMNLTKKRIRNRGRRSMTPERLKEIGCEMSTRLVEVYLKKPNFKVSDSFGAFLNLSLGGVMNPMTDPYERRSAFSLDETIGTSDVSFLEHPDQIPVSVRKSSSRMVWEDATTLQPKFKHLDVQRDAGEVITAFDDQVFYRQGWSASMLFMVSFVLMLKDRRSKKKLEHLQNQYDRLPINENIDFIGAQLRTSVLKGF
jgi:hypothetical protein